MLSLGILATARVNMHEMSLYVRLLLIVSMHARVHVYACPFKMLVVVGARAEELISPRRQLSQSERQRTGTSRRREVGRKAVRVEKKEFDSRQQMPN